VAIMTFNVTFSILENVKGISLPTPVNRYLVITEVLIILLLSL